MSLAPVVPFDVDLILWLPPRESLNRYIVESETADFQEPSAFENIEEIIES